ncbi:MAG: tetratricopeptide repeat protein [Candidatus Omnitrophica bacterium]|nr:tetratricopeptide repeat protein [Candidatus Omnitrophota bacterium]
MRDRSNALALKNKGNYVILCIGESTTFCGGTKDAYPTQLEEILNQHNLGIRFSVVNLGVPTDTSHLVGQLGSNIDKYNPQMVIAMLGINDGAGYLRNIDNKGISPISRFINSLRVYKLLKLIRLHQEANKPIKANISNEALLAQSYIKNGLRFSEATKVLETALSLDNNRDDLHCALGEVFSLQGKSTEAKEEFRKAINLNHYNDKAFCNLAAIAEKEVNLQEAEIQLRSAFAFNPGSAKIAFELGLICMKQNKFQEGEGFLRKAASLNTKDYSSIYSRCGWELCNRGQIEAGEKVFQECIANQPKNTSCYIDLGKFYLEKSRFTDAEALFKKALELDSPNELIYGALAAIYMNMNQKELAEIYYRRANLTRLEYYNPLTVSNYLKLRQIVQERGIRLVCVQYPVRSIEPLKKIFADDKDIIFVDNEKIFREALYREGYSSYFSDMFGGDFGHCTRKGYRLLAGNIANILIKELFKKNKS